MVTVTEEAVITAVLTIILGRAPTEDEVAAGKQDSLVMARVHEILNIGTSTHSIGPDDDMQEAINNLAEDGNGILHLQAGTFDLTDITLLIPSGINLQGTGTATVLDFGGTDGHIEVIGTGPNRDGTVTIANGDTEVVGVGTTFGDGMVGQAILLQDLWYEITAVTDDTHLTIAVPYAGTALSGVTYVISTIVSSVEISGMTLQNTTEFAIQAQYFDDVVINDIFFSECGGCIDADDSSGLQILGCFVQNCDDGYDLTNCQYGVIFNSSSFNISAGDALRMTLCGNWMLLAISYQGITGRAAVFTDTTNFAFSASSLHNSTGPLIEFVSDNDDWSLTDNSIKGSASDGVRLTTSTSGLVIHGNSLSANGGYGVNIMDASAEGNVVGLNTFANNTLGNLNDSGTGTIIGLNSGV